MTVLCTMADTCGVFRIATTCLHATPHEHRDICDVSPQGVCNCKGVCTESGADRNAAVKKALAIDLAAKRDEARRLGIRQEGTKYGSNWKKPAQHPKPTATGQERAGERQKEARG